MKLGVKRREGDKKNAINEIRRQGDIPAIIYSSKGQPEKLTVNGTDFKTILREMKPGQLPTTIFTLEEGGKQRRAIIKDVQYELTTYTVSHIDFVELADDVAVRVKVPVNCTGVADCVGVKLGGFLRLVTRHVRVECLPKHIPTEFVVDVKDLGIRQSRRLKDVAMPAGVRPLAKSDEVLVVIAKR